MGRILIKTERYRVGVYPDRTVLLYTTDRTLVEEIEAGGGVESVRNEDGLYVVVLRGEAASRFLS